MYMARNMYTCLHIVRYICNHIHTYRKLSRGKLPRFSQISDESQKFSLLIDRRCTIDIRNYGSKITKVF